MEPFSLFQFLQTLLSAPPQKTSETAEFTASSEAETPPQKAGPTPQKNEEQTPTQNAAAQFLVDHERRSQRTKKR